MAIALTNTTSGTSDAGSTSLAATAASHTSGNLIAVSVSWTHATATATVPTDTAGNTYVSTTQKVTSGNDHVEIFYAANITGNASNVVTAHFSASSTFRRVMVHQYSGCDTATPYDTGNVGTASAATSVTTGSFTTALADEVIFAGYTSAGSGGQVAGANYTIRLSNIGADSYTEDRIVAATGTYTASFTQNSQNSWMAAASFKQAGGGGGGTVVKQLAALGVG